ncbi:Na(+)/H(+) antiporter [Desulfonema limicola]|uniref:Na(+)/H(+) antiporter NhaA n=1 Tax=Desulfonema limicola TaxID=45656 RepID=A0A975B3C0_9BACT|nr:Na+/H+ antiporter NhaA [Desulfonema limicola]QTA78001.1 Na(+)/H(+) antiporter [Desulfonema limicola]
MESNYSEDQPGIIKIFQPYQWFFSSEVASSVLLLFASISAVYLANSFIADTYNHFLHTEISLFAGKYYISKSLVHWINDGLMALFFFTVGLEIKREILVGELASFKQAMLPVVAAIGGMIVPGLIYMFFNYKTPGAGGWAVPMATDIAFSLGAVALFGKRLPVSLRIFLTAFAIADDLGAVIIIAVFYTKNIAWYYVIISLCFVLALVLANLLWIRWLPLYLILGTGTWLAVMGSGFHATIAGVIVALTIPARGKYNTFKFVQEVKSIMDDFKCHDEQCKNKDNILLNEGHLNSVLTLEMACHNVETPLQRLERSLHPWVVYMVLPLFAFGNAGLSFEGMNISAIIHPVSMGIVLGLFIGKPLGITLLSFIAVKTRLASLPDDVKWNQVIGVSMLGGIGFTMSLFIADIAFTSADFLNYAKLGTLSGSMLSLIGGMVFLGFYSRKSGETQ